MRTDAPTVVWRDDKLIVPPWGWAWACPDCKSWATLPENAAYHKRTQRHGTPTLRAIRDVKPPAVADARLERLRKIEGAARDVQTAWSETAVYYHPLDDALRALVEALNKPEPS